MNNLVYFVVFVLGFVGGVVTWIMVASRDEELARVRDDEVIIKKPSPNMVLVQVSPDVARRLVMNLEAAENSAIEARKMYRNS